MWLCRVLRQSQSVLMSVYRLHPSVKNSFLGFSCEFFYVYKPTHIHRFTFLWVFQSSLTRESACQTCCRSLHVKCTTALILPTSQFCSKIKCEHAKIGTASLQKWLLSWSQLTIEWFFYSQICLIAPPYSNTRFVFLLVTHQHEATILFWQAFIKSHPSHNIHAHEYTSTYTNIM